MALIDCLTVINGHMLNMHIVDILTQMWKAIWGRGAISGEALISDCELSIWDGMGWERGAPLWSTGPRADLHSIAVTLRIFKEMASPPNGPQTMGCGSKEIHGQRHDKMLENRVLFFESLTDIERKNNKVPADQCKNLNLNILPPNLHLVSMKILQHRRDMYANAALWSLHTPPWVTTADYKAYHWSGL